MAPVFDDQIHREEGASLRRRRLRQRDSWWQRNARGAVNEARVEAADDSDNSDDSDDDDARDGNAGAKQKGQKKQQGTTTAPLFSLDPLNPLPAVASGFASLISPPPSPTTTQPSRTTEPPRSTPSSTTSSTLSLPTVPVSNNPVAINPQVSVPQVVTMSSVTVLTTTSFAAPSIAPSQSFIDSIFPSTLTTLTSSGATAAFDNDAPSPTIFLTDTDTGTDNHHDGDSRDGNFSGPPHGGLSPTGEDVLISAGSIGAFILICFVCWIGWRMYKKSKGPADRGDDSPPNALLSRIPYFGRNQRAWNDLGDGTDVRGPPSMYERSSAKGSVYSMADARYMARSMSSARQGPMMLPQLDTNVTYSTANPFSASSQSSAANTHSTYSSQVLSMQNTSYPQQQQHQQQQQQQPPAGLPQLQTSFGLTGVAINPFASPEDGPAPDNMSPNSASNYGNGTMRTIETVSTDRSRMPDPYFNQSELARQASTAFDPAKRAVYRASELSSISSGFGDGDFIVPPPPAAQQDARPFSYAKTSRSRSNSIANRSEVGSAGQRDTVYTTTSEDMPARYRSVNSWVNQQTGRVQRQQERAADEDVPPVPSLPPEQRLTMMMDDGEEPRRYEDTLSSQPPVPSLPTQHAAAADASSMGKAKP